MKKITTFYSFLLAFTLTAYAAAEGPGTENGRQNPFRVLVVTGDQWKDPASYLVSLPGPTGEYSGYEAKPAVDGDSDFHDLVMLLKSWCIPFDVIRLDQQYLDRYMFLDMYEKPLYGAIIWDVNRSDSLLRQDYSIITDIVTKHGTGLIALADRITQPEIQELLGLKYKGSWESSSRMNVTGKHFITLPVRRSFPIDSLITGHIRRPQVELSEGTHALLDQGGYPQLTERELQGGVHAVWIGSDHNFMFSSQGMRTILRRSLTWVIGYSVFRTWNDDIIMIMDDPGGASNNYLEHWHYPELTEEQVRMHLIAPLEKNKAILNVNFVPALVSDKLGRMEPAWRESFTDAFGTKQDYISGKRGWDEGISKGVFTVMCHGLTHMQPDLYSEPGWYGAPYDKEKSEVGWYREFGDTRRLKEIPAAEQLWRMKTAAAWLREQFGVEPLEFCPGGLGSSSSYFKNTAVLAGKAGFGWNGWESGYLGRDMVITGWKYFGTPEAPLIIGAPPDFHDFGITRNPGEFARVFEKYQGKRFISMDEYIAYLHAETAGSYDPAGKRLDLTINYDTHYCRWFASHPSEWNIELADWFTEGQGLVPSVTADNKKTRLSGGVLSIPAGTGKHSITIEFEQGK